MHQYIHKQNSPNPSLSDFNSPVYSYSKQGSFSNYSQQSPYVSQSTAQSSITSINTDYSPFTCNNLPYYKVKQDYIKENQKPLQAYFQKPEQKIQEKVQKPQSQIFSTQNLEPTINKSEYVLPEKQISQQKYTLVLDLDETLIHTYNNNKEQGELQFNVRPFAEQFLINLKNDFEIVVFTASDSEYCEAIVNSIDLQNSVQHKLDNRHMKLHDNGFIKDLRYLGRDMSKVIIVDNLPYNFIKQEENGIEIKDYFNDNNDNLLLKLQEYLLMMARQNVDDVRQFLKPIKQMFI